MKLILTTRSEKKSRDTVKGLQKYLQKKITKVDRSAPSRISFQTEQFDLCSLQSIQDASKRLLSSVPKLDVILLNAGISGNIGIHWPEAIKMYLLDLVYAVTYPPFLRFSVGDVTQPQLSPLKDGTKTREPPLGKVFCANLFGHYLLTHNLSPLLRNVKDTNAPTRQGRVIFIGTLEASAENLDLSDFQGTRSLSAYQSGKRLSDILALTSSMPSTQPWVSRYFSTSSKPATAPLPHIYIAQPGVCNTAIVPLHPFAHYAKICTFYIARLLGSPWHAIWPYKGACAPVWLALAPQTQLDALEQADGPAKWGSATSLRGDERAVRTEVDGWGYGGKVGDSQVFGTGSRRRGAKELTQEDLMAFEALGRECWKEMEALREEWEGLLVD